MSQETLASIIGRAALDPQFLAKLKADPAGATATLGSLTQQELDALKLVDLTSLENFNAEVGRRQLLADFNKNI